MTYWRDESKRVSSHLIGPTGLQILPDIWPYSIHPGSEVELEVLDEDDGDCEGHAEGE